MPKPRNSWLDLNQASRAQSLPRLQLVQFKEIPGSVPLKFVGRIRNNSTFVLSDVEVALCFFDANDELLDVVTPDLRGVGLLSPQQETHFAIELDPLRNRDIGITERVESKRHRVELRFIDVYASGPEGNE